MNSLAKGGLLTLVVGVGATALWAGPGHRAEVASAQMQEAIMKAEDLRIRMGEDAGHVMHVQQLARKEKDVIKLNCVNDKLVQIRPQLNIADRARVSISGGMLGELKEMSEAGQQIHRLREEADQCIGEPVLTEESTNSSTHPYIPDPGGVNPWGNVFEPPAYASPMN